MSDLPLQNELGELSPTRAWKRAARSEPSPTTEHDRASVERGDGSAETIRREPLPGEGEDHGEAHGSEPFAHQVRSEAAAEVEETIYRCRLTGDPALRPEAAVSNEVVVLDERVIAIALRSHDQECFVLTGFTVVHCEFPAITPRGNGNCFISSQRPDHDVEVVRRHCEVQALADDRKAGV
jgi:hypothetical protein